MTWQKVQALRATLWEEPRRPQRSGELASSASAGHLRKEWITIKRYGSRVAAQNGCPRKFDDDWDDYL